MSDPTDPTEAFLAAVSDFHLALAEDTASGSTSASASSPVLRALSTIRLMATDSAAELHREMHSACVAKARDWVEKRTQQLVAEFHLRWHEDADMLAVDRALNEGMALVTAAEVELGETLPVAHEVLGGGRIQADLANKKIAIYGHSIGFPWQGEFRHDLSAAVVAEAYPDAEVTTSNEGY